MRIAAFAFSSAVIAYAGALLAPRIRILDPDSFDITHSVIMLGYPIVGGMNSIWGGLMEAHFCNLHRNSCAQWADIRRSSWRWSSLR